MPVRLTVELDGRIAEPVEVAAYYVVSESLANIGKHARATSATVDVRRDGHQIVVEVVDDGIGAPTPNGGLVCEVWLTESRHSADGCRSGRRTPWHPSQSGVAMQVAIAEDSVLLREGLARLLGEAGFDVIARCRDAEELRQLLKAQRPDVVIVDIRLPPTHTDEGLQAAGDPLRISRRRRARAVPVRGARPGDEAARRLRRGCRYLLKDRISDVPDLAAVRRVATGGSRRWIRRSCRRCCRGDGATTRLPN